MILFKIHGGLGNQLFQWAYSYALSKSHKTFLDISFYNKEQDKYTNFDKRTFDISSVINQPVKLIDGGNHKKFMSSPFKTIMDNFTYDPVDIQNGLNYYFNGFWQNENYFLKYRDEIINSLVLPKSPCDPGNNDCCIHVRRGDYLLNPDHFIVQDISYYHKSLEIIQPNNNIYIITDDPSWCARKFPQDSFIIHDSGSHFKDFSLMSSCKYNIISNSTFSWWAAWINNQTGKKITYPSSWFGPANPPIKDICPTSWIAV
jgi:hypothetical protein